VEVLVNPIVGVEVTEDLVEAFGSARVEMENAAACLIEPEETWVISQSLGDELVFDWFTGSLPPNFEQSIAGRVFSNKGELRWVRDAGGCRYWKTTEIAAAGAAVIHRIRKQPYYLWGMYTKQGTFSENRTVGDFKYPLPPDIAHKMDDRAYIMVAEYLAAEPAVWTESITEIEQILNQPEIVGHRYLHVDCGRNK
jgi:hypothetical protein